MQWKQLDEIEPIIRKYFSYLSTDFGFQEMQSTTAPFSHYINYINNNLEVRIEYAYRHDYINPKVWKNGTNQEIWLLSILDREPDFTFKDYNALMPRVIGLEKSIKVIAELFKENMRDILTGKEWLSNDSLSSKKNQASLNHNYTKIEIKGLPSKYFKDKQEISEAEYLEAMQNQ